MIVLLLQGALSTVTIPAEPRGSYIQRIRRGQRSGRFKRKAPAKPVMLTKYWAFHSRRSISKHAPQTNHRELTVAHVFRIGGTCHNSTVIGGEFCPRRKNSANPEA